MNLRMLQDNCLVRLDIADKSEKLSPGGIVLVSFDATDDATANGIFATVIAVGPGRYADAWIDHETGTAPVGAKTFVPTDSAIVPGARVVLAKAALAGDRVKAEDGEMRIVKTHVIEAVLEDDKDTRDASDFGVAL